MDPNVPSGKRRKSVYLSETVHSVYMHLQEEARAKSETNPIPEKTNETSSTSSSDPDIYMPKKEKPRRSRTPDSYATTSRAINLWRNVVTPVDDERPKVKRGKKKVTIQDTSRVSTIQEENETKVSSDQQGKQTDGNIFSKKKTKVSSDKQGKQTDGDIFSEKKTKNSSDQQGKQTDGDIFSEKKTKVSSDQQGKQTDGDIFSEKKTKVSSDQQGKQTDGDIFSEKKTKVSSDQQRKQTDGDIFSEKKTKVSIDQRGKQTDGDIHTEKKRVDNTPQEQSDTSHSKKKEPGIIPLDRFESDSTFSPDTSSGSIHRGTSSGSIHRGTNRINRSILSTESGSKKPDGIPWGSHKNIGVFPRDDSLESNVWTRDVCDSYRSFGSGLGSGPSMYSKASVLSTREKVFKQTRPLQSRKEQANTALTGMQLQEIKQDEVPQSGLITEDDDDDDDEEKLMQDEDEQSIMWSNTWKHAISKLIMKRKAAENLRELIQTDPILMRFNTAHVYRHRKSFKMKSVFTFNFWKTLVVNPAHSFYYRWSSFISMAVYYNMIVIVLRAAFSEMQAPELNLSWYTCDYFCDFIYVMDTFFKTRLGFLDQGILVTDTKRLTINYVYSWRFFVDILSVFPTDVLNLFIVKTSLYRLNRLFRIFRVNEFYQDSDTRTNSPNMFRLLFLIINILIVIHWNACIFYAFSTHLFGVNADGWGYKIAKPTDLSFIHRYLACFYWSLLTLTAIGDNPPPEVTIAFLYSICCTLIGVLIFATIFGNIGAMINQMNASRTEFQQRVDSVKRYMIIRRVCPQLQARIIQWFSYTWQNRQSVDDRQALAILPEKLRAEIAIHVHLDTLKRVAIFQDCEPGLLVELVLKLRLNVISPGDYICRKGDIGKEMYIVKRGKLVVVSEDGKDIYGTLGDGAVFGEISILNITGNKTGNRRTASVRSVGYSDLFCLSKDDLWNALAEYPEAKHMLTEKGKEVLRKDDLLDEDATIEEERRGVSMEKKLTLISEQIEQMCSKMTVMADKVKEIQQTLSLPKCGSTEFDAI